MGKVITGSEGPVIGISTSLEMYDKLKHESDRLENGWHPYDTFNFLVTAWHLFEDWPKSDNSRALSRTKRHRKKISESMNLVMDVVRDLVNGSKHFNLDPRSANKRRVGEVHTGLEANWYSYFFHENIPGVTVDGQWYFSVRVLRNLVDRYFEWVFDDIYTVKDFPQDLEEAIQYCNISKRNGDSAPKVWLRG